jgi:hypothetical protein
MDAETTRSLDIPVRYLAAAAVAEKYLLEMPLNFIKKIYND